MKFVVNEDCIGCGLCANLCPQVFTMNDNGVSEAIAEQVASELEASAMEALAGCPVDAIHQE